MLLRPWSLLPLAALLLACSVVAPAGSSPAPVPALTATAPVATAAPSSVSSPAPPPGPITINAVDDLMLPATGQRLAAIEQRIGLLNASLR